MAILYPPSRSVKSRRPFGAGILPQREPRLPVGPSADDERWHAENASHDGRWTTVAESEAHFLESTMSRVEYRELLNELSAIDDERYPDRPDYESAELAEIGLTDAQADQLAAESEALDRLCAGFCFA